MKVRSAVSGALRAYKRFVSPMMPPACRFHPSCSEYAAEAVEVHGALKGGLLAAGRVLRCNPWSAGGFDPVPTARGAATPPRA